MRATGTIRRTLSSTFKLIHAARVTVLLATVTSLLRNQKLSLTGLGRGLVGPADQRHRIKRVDRFLGNPRLHDDVPALFGGLARTLLADNYHPIILVDWTDMGSGRHALVASVPAIGRSLPIYAEVHPEALYTNDQVHRDFLRILAEKIVPLWCKPIVVTDAGFKNTWFQAVRKLGWDFIGRASSHPLTIEAEASEISRCDTDNWCSVSSLHRLATSVPRSLGRRLLAKSNPLEVQLVLVKKSAKGRRGSKKANRRGVHPGSTSYKKYQRRERVPWVLATSLDADAREVVGIYSMRMQIEETFRDAKSHRFGWSMEDARCRMTVAGDDAETIAYNERGSKRLQALLLIAALGMLAVHLMGAAAEKIQAHRAYMANTIRDRRVLSLFVLGNLILHDSHPPKLPPSTLVAALKTLRDAIVQAGHPSNARLAAICGDP